MPGAYDFTPLGLKIQLSCVDYYELKIVKIKSTIEKKTKTKKIIEKNAQKYKHTHSNSRQACFKTCLIYIYLKGNENEEMLLALILILKTFSIKFSLSIS